MGPFALTCRPHDAPVYMTLAVVAGTARRSGRTTTGEEDGRMATQVTLKNAAPEYLEHLKAIGRNERTVRTYGNQLRIMMGFFGEERKLGALRPADVGRFLKSDHLLKTPKGKKRAEPTVKQIVRVLRMLLEWAQAQGVVETVAFPKDAMPTRKKAGAEATPSGD